MKHLVFTIWMGIVLTSAAKAADTIVKISDRSFTNATVSSDGVRVKVVSGSGIETFPLAKMSRDDQVRWGYNPSAAASRARQAAADNAALHASFAKEQAALDAANAAQGAVVAANEAKRKDEEAKAKAAAEARNSPRGVMTIDEYNWAELTSYVDPF